MFMYLRTAFIVAFSVFFVSCGSGEKSMEDLLAEKQDLEKQKKVIETQISVIDSIMALRDTSKKTEELYAVEVISVTPGILEHFIHVQGQVESDNNVMVYPKTQGGVITALYVDEGKFVNAGDPLARIEDEVLRKNLDAVKVNMDMAKTAFEKQERLWKQQIGSEMQFLQAKNQKESLEKQIAAMEEHLGMSLITAPISGTVDEVYAKVGQVVSAMSPVGAFRIVNMNDVSFKAELSESYISRVKVGDSVTIFFPSIDDSISSTIKTVGQTIDPTSRTIPVEVSVNSSEIRMMANMIGEMSLMDQRKVNSISVEQDILSKTINGHALFVAVEKEGSWFAEKRDVKTGLKSGNLVEILEGLNAGDRLVVRGFRDLKDGQKITIN